MGFTVKKFKKAVGKKFKSAKKIAKKKFKAFKKSRKKKGQSGFTTWLNFARMKRQISGLKPAMQKSVLRAMVRAGSAVVNKEFKKNLRQHKRTGLLIKAASVKVKLYKGIVLGLVGIKKGLIGADKYGNKVVPANYNHLVEQGRSSFLRKYWRKKKSPIIKVKQPFKIPRATGKFPLRRALNATKSQVTQKMKQKFSERVKVALVKNK